MTTIKVKKKCCESGPRCKRCPAVYKRLEAAGYAERVDKRHYVLIDVVPKRAMKRARARKR
jgi:uncharacterized C2H2 Zn-finger protein